MPNATKEVNLAVLPAAGYSLQSKLAVLLTGNITFRDHPDSNAKQALLQQALYIHRINRYFLRFNPLYRPKKKNTCSWRLESDEIRMGLAAIHLSTAPILWIIIISNYMKQYSGKLLPIFTGNRLLLRLSGGVALRIKLTNSPIQILTLITDLVLVAHHGLTVNIAEVF